MDFFQAQDDARRRTKWLVLLFVIAVAAIILSVYFVITLFWGFDSTATGAGVWWDWERFITVAGGVILLVGGGSLYKSAALRSGGPAVAEMLGGRKVHPNTTDPLEQRYRNVVEEMAVASGTPMPEVYILPNETGINAFAAGHSLSDAAVAVTHGALEQLSRDELQGVVAHEFSHILNGDMRLNLRLVAVLFGILLVSVLGELVFRGALYSGAGRSRSSGGSRDQSGGGMALIVVGIALYVIGYIGIFFGRLIQAAVSRQREYLADAAAVQFTRNPQGIAGALKKIGGYSRGSRLQNGHTEEVSHSLFSDGLRRFSGQGSLFATHPPLARRIRAVDPSFDGKFEQIQAPSRSRHPTDPVAAAGFAEAVRRNTPPPIPVTANLAGQVGTPSPAHLDYAAGLLAAIPTELRDASHDPEEARALIYCLLLDSRPKIRQRQLEIMEAKADPRVVVRARQIQAKVDALSSESRLPMVDLALPALRCLSPAQFQTFTSVVSELIKADGQVTLFDFTLSKILHGHLASHFSSDRRKPIPIYYGFPPLAGALATLLSALAWAADEDHDLDAREKAFQAGARQLPFRPGELVFANPFPDLHHVGKAMEDLGKAALPIRKRFIEAASAVVAYNGRVGVQEAEMLRAICEGLECPMPPVLRPPATKEAA